MPPKVDVGIQLRVVGSDGTFYQDWLEARVATQRVAAVNNLLLSYAPEVLSETRTINRRWREVCDLAAEAIIEALEYADAQREHGHGAADR